MSRKTDRTSQPLFWERETAKGIQVLIRRNPRGKGRLFLHLFLLLPLGCLMLLHSYYMNLRAAHVGMQVTTWPEWFMVVSGALAIIFVMVISIRIKELRLGAGRLQWADTFGRTGLISTSRILSLSAIHNRWNSWDLVIRVRERTQELSTDLPKAEAEALAARLREHLGLVEEPGPVERKPLELQDLPPEIACVVHDNEVRLEKAVQPSLSRVIGLTIGALILLAPAVCLTTIYTGDLDLALLTEEQGRLGDLVLALIWGGGSAFACALTLEAMHQRQLLQGRVVDQPNRLRIDFPAVAGAKVFHMVFFCFSATAILAWAAALLEPMLGRPWTISFFHSFPSSLHWLTAAGVLSIILFVVWIALSFADLQWQRTLVLTPQHLQTHLLRRTKLHDLVAADATGSTAPVRFGLALRTTKGEQVLSLIGIDEAVIGQISQLLNDRIREYQAEALPDAR